MEETDVIRITKNLKIWIDSKKLVPMETYDHTLRRLLEVEK